MQTHITVDLFAQRSCQEGAEPCGPVPGGAGFSSLSSTIPPSSLSQSSKIYWKYFLESRLCFSLHDFRGYSLVRSNLFLRFQLFLRSKQIGSDSRFYRSRIRFRPKNNFPLTNFEIFVSKAFVKSQSDKLQSFILCCGCSFKLVVEGLHLDISLEKCWQRV